jgi:hypothetical protein
LYHNVSKKLELSYDNILANSLLICPIFIFLKPSRLSLRIALW